MLTPTKELNELILLKERTTYGRWWYETLSNIALSTTYQKGRLCANILIRVGGGMERHQLIALSRHSKKEDFGGLLGDF